MSWPLVIIKSRQDEEQELRRLNDELRLYIQKNRLLEINNERNKVFD